MHLVAEEADLAAGYLAYQTKLAERLVQTVRHDNPFAKVRAANNLKQMNLGVSSLQSSVSSYASNQGFQTELANNSLGAPRGAARDREHRGRARSDRSPR